MQLVLRGVPADVDSIARGGKLYDKWWTEADVAEPAGDHPLWALQTTNTAAGSTTWRCKECHGWDYKGVGGAYSSGSHRTNFPGVYRAGATMSRTQLLDVMQGAFDYRHDFSTVMPAGDLTDLVNFLSEGLVNVTAYLDYAAAAPRQADLATGEQLYVNTCAECHGDDGKRINFGDAASPEYVGTVARANPWETLHKIRVGQPATGMPSAIVSGWSAEDVLDVLGYAQTLPGAPAPAPPTVPLAEITYEATWPAWYLTQAKRVYQSSCPACHELPTVESIKAFASDADTVDMAVAMAEGAALNEEDAARVVRYLLALRHDTAP